MSRDQTLNENKNGSRKDVEAETWINDDATLAEGKFCKNIGLFDEEKYVL